MSSLITLALRNIFRNKRRTGITFLAIISGVTGIVVFGGFIEFAFQGLRETTIRTQLGHLQVYKAGYSKEGVAAPHKFLVKEPEKVEAALEGLPGVTAVTRRLTFSGLVSTGENTLICKVTGVVPEREEEFAAFETILDGYQLDEDEPEGGIVGVELMRALGAEVGDYLTLLTTTLDGMINAVEFKVIGVGQTGSQDNDSVFVKLPMPLVQRALNTEAVEKVLVLMEDTEQVDALVPALERALTETGLDLEYKLWHELAYFYHKVVGLYNGLFGVIQVIIGVIVLFSIANTMSMSVFERIREVGTLRAIGTNRGTIMRLFITEGLFLGVLGGLLGIACGVGIALFINFTGGIEIPPPPGMSRGYTSLILIVPSVLAYAFVLTVLVAVLSSIYPAYKAARLSVVEALQHI